MATLRFWTKTNKYWKRVSEHWHNSQVTSDERHQFQTNSTVNCLPQHDLSLQCNSFQPNHNELISNYSMNLSSGNCKAAVGLEPQTVHINSFQDTFLFKKQGISSSLQLRSLLTPMAYTARNYSTIKPTCTAAERAFNETSLIKQFSSDSSKTSVLESMGIDRNSESTNKDHHKDKAKDNDKEDESKKDDNAESAFLRNQRYAKWVLLVMFACGTPAYVMVYGAPKIDDFGEEIKDQYSDLVLPLAYIRRALGELNVVKKEIVEPSSVKLLPDPLTEPYYQPPYTLVIELMDVFLRPVYDSVTGWRFKKRPGIDYFLSQVAPPLYEIVIFTRETGMTAFPLIESMDQRGYIMYRLFRDAARYKSGFSLGNPLNGEFPKLDPYYQKDLKYLNRDLKRVILVDCDKRAFEKQPENGLCLEKWDGSSDDTTLYDLAGLLRAIASSNVDDVRPVLQHYAQNDKPIETFKLAQARMQEDSLLAARSGSTSQLFAGAGSTVSSLFRRR